MVRRNARVLLSVAVLAAGVLTAVGTAAPVAQAAAPVTSPLTPVAPRTNTGGGLAALADVNTYQLTTTPDGAVVYYDKTADQLRRVDPNTHMITSIAGNGSVGTGRTVDTTDPAIDAPLPSIDGLWSDSAGDVFAWMCAGSNCVANHDLYRLDHTDATWHLALTDPNDVVQVGWRYGGFAIAPDGDIIANETTNYVIRHIPAGSDPGASGTVVAGTSGQSGETGDGGPATSATLIAGGPIAVAANGDLVFADSSRSAALRLVTPDGTISTLTSNLVSSTDPSDRWQIEGLATSADGATAYAAVTDAVNKADIVSVPLDGSAPTTIAGPLVACTTASQGCVGPSLAETTENGAPVVISAVGSIDSWSTDGSDPLRYHRFAGVLNDALGVRSPDGTRLDEAYLSSIRAIAVAPSGTVALAGYDGIHTVSSLTPGGIVSTLASGVVADSLQYADDGTLYALVPDPAPHVVEVTPSGTVTVVLGGGTATPSSGALATAVSLSYSASFAVDPTTDTIVFADSFLTGGTLWQLPNRATTIATFGDATTPPPGQPTVVAVAADHTVLDYDGSGLRRVQPNGSSSIICYVGCPAKDVVQLSSGVIVGLDQGAPTALGLDGAIVHRNGSGLGSFGVTAGGREVTAATGSEANGLLAETDPVTAPVSADAPQVQVSTARSSTITVTATKSVTTQQVEVYAGVRAANGDWTTEPVLHSDETDNGSTATFVLRNLFTTFPAASGSVTPPTYRIDVVATDPEDSTHDELVDAPQTFRTVPTTDKVAPEAPTLSLGGGSVFVALYVTRPSDLDLNKVVVCKTTGVAPAHDPRTCDEVGEETPSYLDNPAIEYQTIDPSVATTFTAFAIDDSGNVSAPAVVTHTAAGLVVGAAVSHVYFVAGSGVEQVYWSGGWAAHVRYVTGTIAPATLTGGTEAGQVEDGGAYPGQPSALGFVSGVPVAAGRTVSVSIFTWADNQLGSYRRTSLTIVGGTSSDQVTITATSRVTAGTAPKVLVRLLRNSPTDGTVALKNRLLELYRRTARTTSWTATATARTASDGRASFVAPVPSATTQYMVRTTDGSTVLASSVVATSVLQALSISAPARGKHRHAVSVTGVLAPHRAALVYLQRYEKRRWVRVAAAHSAANGAYRIAYTPTKAGTAVLRTVVSSTSLLVGKASTARSIVIG